MSCYDTYGEVQLKNGNCTLEYFKVGDKADLHDGAYLGYEGIVIIKDGIFIAESNKFTDKWGYIFNISDLLDPRNPVLQGLSRL